ncbi:hypothetical protein [Vannielia litorea]|uniref:hypothetical protein n=1 Tax=Vannielia litorea TaxID=1217970 RepID=UPI001BCAC574|nr:hypothetical protein [Vannielia litorea]MBS8226351.1 hypothetical protein [Vannielia litorea]
MRRQMPHPKAVAAAPAVGAPAPAFASKSAAFRLAQLAAGSRTPGRGVVQCDPDEAVAHANRHKGDDEDKLTAEQVQAKIGDADGELHERRALAILWNRGVAPEDAVAVPQLVDTGFRAGADSKPTEKHLVERLDNIGEEAVRQRHRMDPKRGILGTDNQWDSRLRPKVEAAFDSADGLLPSYMTGYLYERNEAWTHGGNRAFLDMLGDNGAVVTLDHGKAGTILKGTDSADHADAIEAEVAARERSARRNAQRTGKYEEPFGVFEEVAHLMQRGYRYDRDTGELLPPGHARYDALRAGPNQAEQDDLARLRAPAARRGAGRHGGGGGRGAQRKWK